jgi:putative hydrolase of the HAD superfamily
MTPRAVIFDFWGTLAPLAWDRWQSAFGAIAKVLGVPQEQFERVWRADYDRRLVSDLRESMARVCASLGVTREDATEEAFRLRVEMHRDTCTPRDDAASTLRELRARGYKTGLVTNCSSELPAFLSESVLAGLFDVEVFSAVCGFRKPDRAIYELATTQLGVDPALCLYVGDGDDHELEGARDFGLQAVLLRAGDTRPPENWQGPEIARLAQVLELVPLAPAG